MIPLPRNDDLQAPETVPIKREEAREQARLVAALRRCWAAIEGLAQRPIIAAIPNGGSRDGREAMNLKTQGVLAGMPDLIILLPSGEAIFIEMKAKAGIISAVQVGIGHHLDALGHDVIVAHSAEDALNQLRRRFN